MTHAFHDELPGFDDRQIWKDGCDECEARGKSLPTSLCNLDGERFGEAWRRAADWNRDEEVGRISDAERPLLETIWTFQVMFERTYGLPLGDLPWFLNV